VVHKTAIAEAVRRLFKVRGCVVTYDRAAEPGAQTFTVCERRTSD